MNRASSAHDLPEMSSTPLQPATPPLELIICTRAGKPLAHYAYPPSLTPRPFHSILTLAALTVAFHAQNHISDITTASGRIVFALHKCFLVTAFSQDTHCPIDLLRALLRAALTAVYSTLSRAIISHLQTFPNADTSTLNPRVIPLLNALLLDVITHPLPHILQKPVTLPVPVSANPNPIAPMLRSALLKFSSITHALVITASAPFPRCLVAVAAPANCQLTAPDILTLINLPPLRADAKWQTPTTLFLHSVGFRVAYNTYARSVELRLDPDHYESFKNAVGGADWRPEWTSAGSDIVWILALSTQRSDQPEQFLDFVERRLDRSRAARDVIISMEKPWIVDNIHGVADVRRYIKGVVLIHNHRIVGTLGAFTHENGIAMLRNVLKRKLASHERAARWKAVHSAQLGLQAVCFEERYLMTVSDCVPLQKIIHVMESAVVPWLKKFTEYLLPEQDRVTVQPATPLSGFLAPFDS